MMSANHTTEKLQKNKDASDDTLQTRSLPLFQDYKAQLYNLGNESGMECMPLRSPPGPYHYNHHVIDQTKSLQELQNEVGALLEFRDLVIETFPDLKSKIATSQSNSTITGIVSASSLASRREWEPGIRVRRKIGQKDSNSETTSSLVRSRSNSHSSKQHNQQQHHAKEPKSGEGNSSVVQDSGFSTETSSSKETHSSGSTNGGSQVTTVNNRVTIDTEDELWNLLDVIHRKSNRLREEVEHLRLIETEKCKISYGLQRNKSFQTKSLLAKPEDIHFLRKERDRLLDKLSEMEAETLSCKIKESRMQDEMDVVIAAKKDLEHQLNLALCQKLELNSKLNDLGIHLFNKSGDFSSSNMRQQHLPYITPNLSSDITLPVSASISQQHVIKTKQNMHFAPVVLSHNNNQGDLNISSKSTDCSKQNKFLLGHLDEVLSSPSRIPRLRYIDSKKIAAILLETNFVELQRHLLTITVQNQILQTKLEKVLKSRTFLSKQLDKSKEDIEDLKFQLEEKNIELEGARAQLRIVESKSLSKSEYGSPEQTPTRSAIMLPPVTINTISSIVKTTSDTQTLSYRDANQISTPSMKAMTPLAMDDALNLHHSSSTESAQDQTELHAANHGMSKLRPPSKIPLPGQKGYVTPKPPSGKNIFISKTPSGPPSNRSLNKSTSNLQVQSSGPTSINKAVNTSPNRSESSQSWRSKEVSLERQRNTNGSNSSSIPIASNNKSTVKLNTSPVLPRAKRDSLTSRIKNLDSLSRHLSQTSLNCSSNLPSSSKKDLNSSFSNNNNNLQPTVPMRRINSSSVHRYNHPIQSSINNNLNKINNSINNSSNLNSSNNQQDVSDTASDPNKVRSGLRANFWNWLKI